GWENDWVLGSLLGLHGEDVGTPDRVSSPIRGNISDKLSAGTPASAGRCLGKGRSEDAQIPADRRRSLDLRRALANRSRGGWERRRAVAVPCRARDRGRDPAAHPQAK